MWVPAGLALLGAGALIGRSAAPTEPAGAEEARRAEVVVRTPGDEPRTFSAREAADRIERLERALERRRVEREREEEPDLEADAPSAAPVFPDTLPPPLLRPDGRAYTAEEIRDLARSSTDPTLRRQAIQALRRDDSDAARGLLRELLADPETPPEMRVEAAASLARPPHRDKLPEELIAALREETDPSVRKALVLGVTRLRDRGAWMSEISGLLRDEHDSEVRRALFEAVARTARDPAARAELLAVATDSGASIDERRVAMAALARTRPDAASLRQLSGLREDPDPAVRARAVEILATARALSPGDLGAALGDENADVRRAALASGLAQLAAFQSNKAVPRPQVQALVQRAVDLATSDPDPAVRRAAVYGVGSLPQARREQVLAAARQDADLFVRVIAYARSPNEVARSGTGTFLGAMDSSDAALRDTAYRQLQRLHGLTVPYDTRWNAKARAAALSEIQRQLASR